MIKLRTVGRCLRGIKVKVFLAGIESQGRNARSSLRQLSHAAFLLIEFLELDAPIWVSMEKQHPITALC